MSNEPISPDPELNAVESVLGSLVPARSRIDRDRLMFRAGQASVHSSPSRRGYWNVVAASLALIALGEAALLAHGPPVQVLEKVVVVREQAKAPVDLPSEPTVDREWESRPTGSLFSLGQTPYERLAGQVLRYGLDGLPASPSAAWADSRPSPASSGEMLQEELRRILEPGDHS